MELFQGLMLILRTPALWRYCVRPWLYAIAAYVVLGVLLWSLLAPRVEQLLERFAAPGAILHWAAGALVVLVWVLASSYVFLFLGGIFASFLWDPLSKQVEELDGGSPGDSPLTFGQMTNDTIVRSVVAAVLAIAGLIGSLIFTPIFGWVLASFLALCDYTSPACLRRGWTLGPQVKRMLNGRGVMFGALTGLVGLLPVLNLLLWPAAIAGGTLLVRRLDVPVTSE